LGTFSFCFLLSFLQSTLDRRREPDQVRFQDIIGCPRFQRFDGNVFAQLSRNKDEWQIGRMLVRNVQRRHSIE
jgi:hypothetical protein